MSYTIETTYGIISIFIRPSRSGGDAGVGDHGDVHIPAGALAVAATAAAGGAEYNVGDYYNTANTYCATYQEEISGFMAGYAAVKLGYRHLGFLGGMSVPAVASAAEV